MGSKTCFPFGSVNFTTANYPDIFVILCTKQKKYDQKKIKYQIRKHS